MTTYRPGDKLRTPVDIAADAEEFPYECPDCGEGHDGMSTGTEYCPSCEVDRAEADDNDA
jgi:uncharacterized protein (DUF983 family)